MVATETDNASVQLPEGTIDLTRELVPAVQCLLAKGLPDSFIRSCVRIGGFQPFPGGLKADLVGGLTINVNAVLKLGGPELEAHRALIDAVNRTRPRTFAEVLEVVHLEDERRVLLMEQLRKYDTLLDLVYHRDTPRADLLRILEKALACLAAVHGTRAELSEAWQPKQTGDPFSQRLREKLTAALAAEESGERLLAEPGRVMGLPCPPLGQVLDEIAASQAMAADRIAPVLVHGDLHLRNILVRRHGPGFAVRLIDPNPEIGCTDPAYDIGKLLHFAEPVGWTRAAPALCRAWLDSGPGNGRWSLHASVPDAPVASEYRRAAVEATILEYAASIVPAPGGSLSPRLHLARAAAHVGLLPRLAGDTNPQVRQFVLAHTLHALAQWHAATTGGHS